MFCMETSLKKYVPFSGAGFAAQAQAFVNFGASLGAVNVTREGVMPCRRTIRSQVTTLAQDVRNKIRAELASQPSIAVTTDHWTDEHTSRSYMAVTAHYMSEKWSTCSRILTMTEMKESHTGKELNRYLGTCKSVIEWV